MFRSNIFDGATAVGWIFDTLRSITTAGAKLTSFRNATTEKASVGYDGTLTSAGALSIAGASTLTGAVSGGAGISATTTLTAGTGITATTGDIVATAGDAKARRLTCRQGTALSTSDFALSSGWGDTASKLLPTTSFDTRGYCRVTCGGAGIGASPTVTLTFADGAYPALPGIVCSMYSGQNDQITIPWSVTGNSSSAVFIWGGTPTAGKLYGFTYHIIG